MPVKSERQKNMWNKIQKLNLYFSCFFYSTYIAVMKLRKMDLLISFKNADQIIMPFLTLNY